RFPVPASALRSISSCCADPPALHSFPTRRSSDLTLILAGALAAACSSQATPTSPMEVPVFSEPALHGGSANGGNFGTPLSGRERSEEHTSELQSRENLVCRLLLEKKNKRIGGRRR